MSIRVQIKEVILTFRRRAEVHPFDEQAQNRRDNQSHDTQGADRIQRGGGGEGVRKQPKAIGQPRAPDALTGENIPNHDSIIRGKRALLSFEF